MLYTRVARNREILVLIPASTGRALPPDAQTSRRACPVRVIDALRTVARSHRGFTIGSGLPQARTARQRRANFF